MNWHDWRERIFGDPDAVAAYKDAKADLRAYGEHQRETQPRIWASETPEYYRLNNRVIEAEKHIPPWRAGFLFGPPERHFEEQSDRPEPELER